VESNYEGYKRVHLTNEDRKEEVSKHFNKGPRAGAKEVRRGTKTEGSENCNALETRLILE